MRDLERRLNAAILTLGALSVTVWVAAVLVTAGRGLDLTDEGFYLLSYRWWDSTPRTFTGAQYLYGPVYEWLSYDVSSLRLVRLFTVVAAHCLLAHAASSWVVACRTERHPGWLRPSAIFVVVLAGGGVVYGWLPLSPGYNDVSLLGALVLASVVLHIAAAGLRRRRVAWAWGLLVGPTVMAQVLAKWTSAAVTILVVVIATLLVVRDLRPRGVGRLGGVAASSFLISVLAIHLLIMPLPQIIEPMRQVTALLSRDSNDPLTLLTNYLTSALVLIALAIPAIAIGVALHLVARRVRSGSRTILVLVGPIIAVGAIAIAFGGLHAGRANIAAYAATLLVATALVVIAPVMARRDASPSLGRRGRLARLVVLVLMGGLPGAQALGTGNEIYAVAINGFGLWCVLVVASLDRIPSGAPEMPMAWAATCLAVGLAGWLAFDASVNHAYRTDTFPPDPGLFTSPSTGSLTIDRETAGQLVELRSALSPYLRNSGTPVMAFDEMAGLVLVLDGRSVGEAWYSRSDPDRSAIGIVHSCRSEAAGWPNGRPVLIFNRPVGPPEHQALAGCGLSFPHDYRELRVSGGPDGIAVYVPLDD